MNREAIAERLTREMTAAGAESLREVSKELQKTRLVAQKAMKQLDEAYESAHEVLIRLSGLSRAEDSPEAETAGMSIRKAKDIQMMLGTSIARINQAIKDSKALQQGLQ